MPNIPLVGQPCKILMHYHMAMVQCLCLTEPMQLMMIVGWGPVSCPNCHKTYTALGLNPDGTLILTMTPGKVL